MESLHPADDVEKWEGLAVQMEALRKTTEGKLQSPEVQQEIKARDEALKAQHPGVHVEIPQGPLTEGGLKHQFDTARAVMDSTTLRTFDPGNKFAYSLEFGDYLRTGQNIIHNSEFQAQQAAEAGDWGKVAAIQTKVDAITRALQPLQEYAQKHVTNLPNFDLTFKLPPEAAAQLGEQVRATEEHRHAGEGESSVTSPAAEVQTPDEMSRKLIVQAKAKIEQLAKDAASYSVESDEVKKIVGEIGALERIIGIEEAKLAETNPEQVTMVEALSRRVAKHRADVNFFERNSALSSKEQRETMRHTLEDSLKTLYSQEATLAAQELKDNGAFHYEFGGRGGTIEQFGQESVWLERAITDSKDLSPSEKFALVGKFFAIQDAIIKEAEHKAQEAEERVKTASTTAIIEASMHQADVYRKVLHNAQSARERVSAKAR